MSALRMTILKVSTPRKVSQPADYSALTHCSTFQAFHSSVTKCYGVGFEPSIFIIPTFYSKCIVV